MKGHDSTRATTRNAGSADALRLPIQVRGETIGEFSITIPVTREQALDPEDVAFARSFVDQVGQTLENARLLEETERLAQREKAVADAADKIHRSTEINDVLRTAVNELNRIMGRRGISVQLGFSGTLSKTSQTTPTATEATLLATGDGQATRPEGGE